MHPPQQQSVGQSQQQQPAVSQAPSMSSEYRVPTMPNDYQRMQNDNQNAPLPMPPPPVMPLYEQVINYFII